MDYSQFQFVNLYKQLHVVILVLFSYSLSINSEICPHFVMYYILHVNTHAIPTYTLRVNLHYYTIGVLEIEVRLFRENIICMILSPEPFLLQYLLFLCSHNLGPLFHLSSTRIFMKNHALGSPKPAVRVKNDKFAIFFLSFCICRTSLRLHVSSMATDSTHLY